MFRLDGRTALVTGAGQGVGAGIATALARQGARLVVNDLDEGRAAATAKALQAIGGTAQVSAFDVSDADAIGRAVAAMPAIDILVNNVGNYGAQRMATHKFLETDAAELEGFLAVNLHGVMNCTRAVLPGMMERGWGRIITISSEAGRKGAGFGVTLYGAAKAGAAHFMRHLSQEVGRKGVTANIISLGIMNNVSPEFAAPMIKLIPAGRAGSPEDAGAAAAYLASEEAAYVNGATLVVNGGADSF